jgi:hypothetical protein
VNGAYREPLEKGGLIFSGHVARWACCPKSWSGRTIRGSSACSSTRTEDRKPFDPHPLFAHPGFIALAAVEAERHWPPMVYLG